MVDHIQRHNDFFLRGSRSAVVFSSLAIADEAIFGFLSNASHHLYIDTLFVNYGVGSMDDDSCFTRLYPGHDFGLVHRVTDGSCFR